MAKDFNSCFVVFVILPLLIIWANPTMKKYFRNILGSAGNGIFRIQETLKKMIGGKIPKWNATVSPEPQIHWPEPSGNV